MHSQVICNALLNRDVSPPLASPVALLPLVAPKALLGEWLRDDEVAPFAVEIEAEAVQPLIMGVYKAFLDSVLPLPPRLLVQLYLLLDFA